MTGTENNRSGVRNDEFEDDQGFPTPKNSQVIELGMANRVLPQQESPAQLSQRTSEQVALVCFW